MMSRDGSGLCAHGLGLVLMGLVGVLILTGVAAGCGQGQTQPGVGVTPSPPAISPPATATPGATDPVTFGSGPTSGASRTKDTVNQMTVRGHIQAGVEAGCMILNADGGAVYLLLGGDRQVINAGGRVEVVGEPQPGLMTTCQQGIPFQVVQVRTI